MTPTLLHDHSELPRSRTPLKRRATWSATSAAEGDVEAQDLHLAWALQKVRRHKSSTFDFETVTFSAPSTPSMQFQESAVPMLNEPLARLHAERIVQFDDE